MANYYIFIWWLQWSHFCHIKTLIMLKDELVTVDTKINKPSNWFATPMQLCWWTTSKIWQRLSKFELACSRLRQRLGDHCTFHCMQDMSRPPVVSTWLSSGLNWTLVTWLLWPVYEVHGACVDAKTHKNHLESATGFLETQLTTFFITWSNMLMTQQQI